MKLLADVAAKYHPEIIAAELKIGLLVVDPARDEGGMPKSPALTHGGNRAIAKISLVSVKDRVHKPYDAIVQVDNEVWLTATNERKAAILDHELTHIAFAVDERGERVLASDGRPKLRLRADDYAITGFYEVAQRHGEASVEVESMFALFHSQRQLLFPFVDSPAKQRRAG